jgi:hypothetical protein
MKPRLPDFSLNTNLATTWQRPATLSRMVLAPSNNVFAKNQLDNREHCLQEDLFKVGDVDG